MSDDEGLGQMHNHLGFGDYETEIIEIRAHYQLLEKFWNTDLITASPNLKPSVNDFCSFKILEEAAQFLEEAEKQKDFR